MLRVFLRARPRMTQRLGQTEAFELPPSKKLIVPRGHTSWWGVDPSTLRVAIATVSVDHGGPGSAPRRRSKIKAFDDSRPVVQRLPEIREETYRLAQTVSMTFAEKPGVIVVEKPAGFGDRPNPELAYAAGATLCGLVEFARGSGLKVLLIEGARWKKVACGRGDIKKPKPRSGVEYPVLTWARTVGFTGSSWDEADAWGIAEYARRTYALDQR